MKRVLYLGIDIGSVALKIAVVNNSGALEYSDYRRLYGQPAQVLSEALENLEQQVDTKLINGVVATGNGGSIAHELIGGDFVNEVLSLSKAVECLTPEIKTVIEMGGSDSKLFMFRYQGRTDSPDGFCYEFIMRRRYGIIPGSAGQPFKYLHRKRIRDSGA